jgi:2-iminobutanoate/2-iminopropanoate deaminase
MAFRESIDIEGVAHSAPIPFGAKLGNLIFSSAIMGADPANGDLPSEPAAQVALMFQNLRAFLAKAGASTDEIGHMTVYLADNAYRDFLNKEWLDMFPNEHSRPARHVMIWQMPRGMLCLTEIIAVKG